MLPREIGCFLWKNIPEPWVTALQNGFAANPQGLRRADRAPLCRTACSRGNSGVLDLHHIGRVQISNTGAGVGVLFGGVHNALISPAVQIVQRGIPADIVAFRAVAVTALGIVGAEQIDTVPKDMQLAVGGVLPQGKKRVHRLFFYGNFSLPVTKLQPGVYQSAA